MSGAEGELDPIAIKIAGGIPPLNVLANGLPLPAKRSARTLFFAPDGPGFVRLTVTDATGAPAVGKAVTVSVWPEEYLKGSLAWDAAAKLWTYAGAPTRCPNEDLNRDGFLNAGEDTNGNGTLEPGLPVTVIGPTSGSSATLTTDSTGSATFKLQYGENFVPWVATRITARASVGGTESSAGMNYFLGGASEDFTNEKVAPAGVVSPYGTGTACTDPN